MAATKRERRLMARVHTVMLIRLLGRGLDFQKFDIPYLIYGRALRKPIPLLVWFAQYLVLCTRIFFSISPSLTAIKSKHDLILIFDPNNLLNPLEFHFSNLLI